ncbi:hypothetical protein LSH36_11g10083 [Paralvinella palmiformis]|uniref:Protein MIX23 n=1 Tax=Paralvinella palmiformis TaxID=53620 RepID=A0AAD9KCT2_9ANNE|nr:hypothetical protein LSH36_11g10083 [Paralvinella palmiformis]
MSPQVIMSAAGAAHEDSTSDIQCHDFSLFQELLKKMRMKDDRITHSLNTTIPTQSFAGEINASEKCKSLYEELLQSNGRRVSMIKKCIREVASKVEEHRKLRQADMDDVDTLKALKKEQTRLRQMQAELSVEEIVMDQSLKVTTDLLQQDVP